MLRFDDGLQVALAADTALKIVDYRYSQKDPWSPDNRVVLELERGAIRVVTGWMAHVNAASFTLRAPQATSMFRTLSNLDVNALVGDTFNTPVQIYDSVGASHVITVTYTRTATGWDYEITVPGNEVVQAPPSTAPPRAAQSVRALAKPGPTPDARSSTDPPQRQRSQPLRDPHVRAKPGV